MIIFNMVRENDFFNGKEVVSKMLYYSFYSSPIGKMLLISDGCYLNVVKLECHRFYNEFENNEMTQNDNLIIFQNTKNWLNRYFNKEKPEIHELPLDPKGSEFRKVVWNLLCQIPYGKTTTYGELAKQVANITGKNKCAQAVGNAVGHNPISVIIPCHRVIGRNGNLTGYGGGINNKIYLLELEGIDTSDMIVPLKGTAL